MATTLDDFLAELSGRPLPAFQPYCTLGNEADALTVFYRPDPYESRRLSDNVTLYTSLDDPERIVGCRIKCIRALLENAPTMLHVTHGKVTLRMIFWAISAREPAEGHSVIMKLAEEAGDIEVPMRQAA
jgi:hypothetical protein